MKNHFYFSLPCFFFLSSYLSRADFFLCLRGCQSLVSYHSSVTSAVSDSDISSSGNRSRAADLCPCRSFFQTVFGLSPAGFYALFLGLFCGFPMGARITAQLYEAEEIDRNEACYLLTFCSSPSPAFLSSYVILTAFSGQIHPGFVFGVLYGSNFLTGFLFRLVFRRFRLHRHTAHRTHSMEKRDVKTDFQRKPAGHLYHERI